jgi:hypothetical protein
MGIQQFREHNYRQWITNDSNSENKRAALQQLLESFGQMSNILLYHTRAAAFRTAHVDYCSLLRISTSYVPLTFMPEKWQSPLLAIHLSQRFFHCWNASWNVLSIMARSSLIAFSRISSMVWKRRSHKVVLSLGNRKKSAGTKSGEYGGWGTTDVSCFAK